VSLSHVQLPDGIHTPTLSPYPDCSLNGKLQTVSLVEGID